MIKRVSISLKPFLLIAVALVLFQVASDVGLAQRTDRLLARGNVLYGDLKIEGTPMEGTFQVILYAGVNQMAQTTIGANGRYRFSGVPNGEYNLVVHYESQIVYKEWLRLAESQPTDVRKDIVLTAQVSGSDMRPPGFTYARSAANQKLFDSAMAASEKKALGEAVKSLEEVVASDPKDYIAWTELGTVRFKQDKLKEAEDAYLGALNAKPEFLLAQINLGKARLAQKNYEGAIEVLSKAVTAAAENADVQHYLGEAYLGAKKGSKAVVHLNEALRLDPKGKADIHLRLGTLYNAAGMKDKAALEYEQFLTKRPEYPDKKKLQDYITQNRPK